MYNFIHRFLNPHCRDCFLEQTESKRCDNCDTLKLLLEQERHQNQLLLNTIIELNKPLIPEKNEVREEKQELKPSFVPWRVRQRELEANDRKEAELRKKKIEELKFDKVDTEDLEKELGVSVNE